jgi:23S rRNA (guanine1835-N2)-methyltransferase
MTNLPESPNDTLTLADTSLALSRFPLKQKNRSLQAWDAADEYLIETVSLDFPDVKRVLVINDAFGALSCFLADKTLFHVSDSKIARLGCEHNMAANQLTPDITYLTPFDSLPEKIDLVIMKLPKSAGFLSYLLSALSKSLSPECQVIAAGKAKEIQTATLKQFEHFFGACNTSLAKKKARLIFAKPKNQDSKFPVRWMLENTSYQIVNHANVFSRDSLDIGARFFMQHLPSRQDSANIIDLGCGNGVIGLSLLDSCPNASITFVDESAMAVQSAHDTIELNKQNELSRCRFVQNDCLSGFDSNSADIITCNPPFHQQNAITDHIAWQMFTDSFRVLRRGGELRIIGNRHLNYHEKLKRLFGGYKVIASNNKFIILGVTKKDN